MQLMSDAISVLGSRIGFAWNPAKRESYLIRHREIKGIPLSIECGLEIDGRKIVLPLTHEGSLFEFLDQDSTPTSMIMSGIDPQTGLHVKLIIRIPLRPRDAEFSTTPALFFEVSINRMAANFRWTNQQKETAKGRLFLRFNSQDFRFEKKGNDISINYDMIIQRPPKINDPHEGVLIQDTTPTEEKRLSSDILAIIEGPAHQNGLEAEFSLDKGMKGPVLKAAWCVYDAPVLSVLGTVSPFKYTQYFTDINPVVDWAKKNYEQVEKNSANVDGILLGHTMGESISHLLANTLHAWLYCSWYVKQSDGRDWFSVWEGSCFFHSTVDVEYTQTPFYLTVWPELLGLELDQWPHFGKDGSVCLGDRGKGTLILSHDMGALANADRQYYPHDMEVEENANYVLMAYAYWRRTGDDSLIKKHAGFMQKLLNFILLCDTTGNGIPDKGCANTIDDASPAIQFGHEQIYLGVKAMAAMQVGKIMLDHAKTGDTKKYDSFAKLAKKTIETEGWKNDHYVVTLTKVMDGLKNPWTGEVMHGELEGWDAFHIYTANGLALLDMTAYDTGLSPEKLMTDIRTAMPKTMMKYGCRHTSYVNQKPPELTIPGLASIAGEIGWVSMNMLRDIAGAYRGLDLFAAADRYWDWQVAVNTQDLYLFFETFYGNNLNLYPRGIAIYGYFDAAAGLRYDKVAGIKTLQPVRASMETPLLLFADWEKGTVPKVITTLKRNKIEYKIKE